MLDSGSFFSHLKCLATLKGKLKSNVQEHVIVNAQALWNWEHVQAKSTTSPLEREWKSCH